MNTMKISIGLYASNSESLESVDSIFKIIYDVEKLLDITITHFAMTYKLNSREITKTLKFSEKNLEKLADIDLNSFSYLSFDSLKENKNFGDTLISINLPMNIPKTHPTIISIIIDTNIFIGKELGQYIVDIVNMFILAGFKLHSSIVEPISYNKLPEFYLMGVSSPNLSDKEELILNALSDNIMEFKRKIWDIFWMNIFKSEHLDSVSLYEVAKIVGEKNIIKFENNYLIKIPMSLEEYLTSKDKGNEYVSKLRKIFQQQNLIMYME